MSLGRVRVWVEKQGGRAGARAQAGQAQRRAGASCGPAVTRSERGGGADGVPWWHLNEKKAQWSRVEEGQQGCWRGVRSREWRRRQPSSHSSSSQDSCPSRQPNEPCAATLPASVLARTRPADGGAPGASTGCTGGGGSACGSGGGGGSARGASGGSSGGCRAAEGEAAGDSSGCRGACGEAAGDSSGCRGAGGEAADGSCLEGTGGGHVAATERCWGLQRAAASRAGVSLGGPAHEGAPSTCIARRGRSGGGSKTGRQWRGAQGCGPYAELPPLQHPAPARGTPPPRTGPLGATTCSRVCGCCALLRAGIAGRAVLPAGGPPSRRPSRGPGAPGRAGTTLLLARTLSSCVPTAPAGPALAARSVDEPASADGAAAALPGVAARPLGSAGAGGRGLTAPQDGAADGGAAHVCQLRPALCCASHSHASACCCDGCCCCCCCCGGGRGGGSSGGGGSGGGRAGSCCGVRCGCCGCGGCCFCCCLAGDRCLFRRGGLVLPL